MLRMGLAGAVRSGESPVSEDTVEATTPDERAQRFDHYDEARRGRETGRVRSRRDGGSPSILLAVTSQSRDAF
jgi:hypothetical protein